jgi:3-deoxy-D-manno-octulosonic-acid transferase
VRLSSEALRRAACRGVAAYIRLVWRTSRWRTIRGDVPRRLHAAQRPFILAFWHGRLLMMPMAWDLEVPIRMLISAHRDGRLIADSVAHFGIGSIAGSSSRGGTAALRQMVRALREGACVGITPDGPRGPAEVASEGVVAAARLGRVPIVPLSYASSPRRLLRTWDRFHLALPFGEGAFAWGEPIEVPGEAQDLEPWRRLVEERLTALGREAEQALDRRAAPLVAYRVAARLLSPALHLLLRQRRARGKEDPSRLPERTGLPSRPRPDGPLVWFHAASVGEATSTLPLIERLRRDRPSLSILLTTGTVTSARLIESRITDAAVLHQFAPLDQPAWVARFLDHWRPDLAVWVESELWPNLVRETRARNVPMILLNARLSRRSFARWQRFPQIARELIGSFDLALAQDAAQGERLAILGARRVLSVGDLKSAADPLPVDDARLAELAEATRGRPLWLAASTHPGEEAAVIEAQQHLRTRFPNLLTIIAPRHPSRSDEVKAILPEATLHSKREAPNGAFHLVDTIGELGLYYRLASVVFVGGSLTPKGGHNPLEAALLDCAIVMGPDTANCAASAGDLAAAGALRTVRDAASLAEEVGRLLADPAERKRRAEAGAGVAARYRGVLDGILEELTPFLDRLEPVRNAAA